MLKGSNAQVKSDKSKSPMSLKATKSFNRPSKTIKIQGIEKKPMLLNLLKKIELKPMDSRSGLYTHRVTDLKLRGDMTQEKTPRGSNPGTFHRTKKTSSIKRDGSVLINDKTFEKRKNTKGSKSNKNLFKKPKKSIKREDKSQYSKKVTLQSLTFYRMTLVSKVKPQLHLL